jgi:signal peptidase I
MSDALPSSSWKKVVAGVVVSLAIVVLAGRVFVFQLANVPDNNMQPTLGAGDMTVVNMLADVGVGDVALIEAGGTLMMRRVVAVGGQSVALKDGLLVVDGAEVKTAKGASYTYQDLPGADRGVADKTCLIYDEANGKAAYNVCIGQGNRVRGAVTAPVKVPAGGLFVLCDNRLYCGIDSREFGAVESGDILGRVQVLVSQGEGSAPSAGAEGPFGLWREIR